MKNKFRSALIGLAFVASGAMPAAGQMGGHAGQSQGQGGDHGGMGAMNAPGQTVPMCGSTDMPRYCEPSFMVVSSVRGVQIVNVVPAGDKGLMLTLKTYGPLAGKSTPRLVIVGGGTALAGATTVGAGWKDGTVVHIDLEGSGDVYAGAPLRVHAFPLTGR